MGHTGEGIDRERAHLHLELNLLLNADFRQMVRQVFSERSRIDTAITMAKIWTDWISARLYLELNKNPQLTIPEFFTGGNDLVPRAVAGLEADGPSAELSLVVRGQTEAKSWEISFNQAGIPIRFEARVQTRGKAGAHVGKVFTLSLRAPDKGLYSGKRVELSSEQRGRTLPGSTQPVRLTDLPSQWPNKVSSSLTESAVCATGRSTSSFERIANKLSSFRPCKGKHSS